LAQDPLISTADTMHHELIDICFNFTHSAFRRDETAVLERAIAAGVGTALVTGSSVEESRYGVELAQRYPEHLYATVGVHPHLSRDWDETSYVRLRELAAHERVRGVGEAGLDYNRDYSPRPTQRHAFVQQMQLAAELGLPLFLHQRDAHGDFTALLREHRNALAPVVVHCFTGDLEQLDSYLDLDLHIGITGWICDERRGRHLCDLLPRIPRRRLMLETDAPYLVPRDLRPQPRDRRNEPAFLPHILNTVAACLGRTPECVAEDTTRTARDFFSLR
jgi:TatD DNase family protein